MNAALRSPFVLPRKRGWSWLAALVERALGLSALDRHYRERPPQSTLDQFLDFTLTTLDVGHEVLGQGLDAVPASGAAVVVANHPFGGVEGVLLGKLLRQRRPDVKILVNDLLARIPELRELFIPVSVLDPKAKARNANGLREALRHLQGGGLLLIFPAGMVASYDLRQRRVTERAWNRLAGHLVQRSGACAVPMFIEGRNSVLFHLLGLIHFRLRTLLLPRQMLNRRGTTVRVHVGDPVTGPELTSLGDADEIVRYLRLATYLLPSCEAIGRPLPLPRQQPLAPAVARADLLTNLAALDPEHLLLRSGEIAVYCAPAARLGAFLPELARLRELTFRAAGEGTGRALDSDRFDPDYLHLFLWQETDQEIVGAYRLGATDAVTARRGLDGLYTRQLFHYDRAFLDGLGTSLEMGRSFVQPRYQRNPQALDLLWKGIGAFVSRHRQYTTLFGPVSISAEYSALSRQLIMHSLSLHFGDSARAGQVRPRQRLREVKAPWSHDLLAVLTDERRLSRLIKRIEGDKSLPVLLRQYLNLSGRLICFHVDREFSNTLVGLIAVDLRRVEPRMLKRYLTADAAKALIEGN